jgi:hypothetical protein
MMHNETNGHIVELPANIDAEQGLLGAILIDNTVAQEVASILPPDAFSNPLHTEIFDAAMHLIRAHKRADAITLRPTFQNAPDVESEDGRGMPVSLYLGRLTAAACVRAHAMDYARILADLRERREIVQACQDAIAAATDISRIGSAPTEWSNAAAALQRAGAPRGINVEARCLADVDPVPISWLWPERLALGKLSLIAGAPGLGKSQLTCALTAAVTTGGRWPDATRSPLGSAIFITCEDDAGDTIGPRLDAAGADVSRVHLLDWALDSHERAHFDVRRHVPALASLLQ